MTHDTCENKETREKDFYNIKPISSSARSVSALPRVSSVTGGVGLYGCFNMENGFVLLHRNLRDHWISSDHKTLSVFIQILLRVEWKSGRSVFVNKTEVKLRPGEMTFGTHQMAKWCGLTRQMVRTALERLKSTNMVTIKTTNKFSILYLVNWEKYQSKPSNQPSDQPTLNQRLTNAQPHLNNTIKKQDNKEGVSEFSFDAVWKLYPNKDGKKQAEKHFKASVKSQEDYSNMHKALKNYLQSRAVQAGYIKNGSTWFNNWQDWIDYKEVTPNVVDKQETTRTYISPEQLREIQSERHPEEGQIRLRVGQPKEQAS